MRGAFVRSGGILLTLALLAALLAASFMPGCGRGGRPEGGHGNRALVEMDLGGDPATILEALEKEIAQKPGDCALLEARAAALLRVGETGETALAETAAAQVLRECKTAQFLEEGIGHRNAQVRVRAISVVGALQVTPLLPLVRRRMEDHSESVRRATVRALGQMKDTKSRLSMLLAVKDSAWAVRAEAASALVNIGKPGDIGRLFPMLQDPDLFVRYQAFDSIIKMASAGNRKELLRAADGREGESARLPAALGLAGLGDATYWSLIELALYGEEARQCRAAARALVRLDQPRALRAFHSFLAATPPAASAREIADLVGSLSPGSPELRALESALRRAGGATEQ